MKLLCDRIEKFNGTREEDVEAWIDKLKVLAASFAVKEIDVTKQMPAMLGGAAYEVWAALSQNEKESEEHVFKQLRCTFGIPRFEAWRQLKMIRYEPGSNIEILANSARRLLRVCNNGNAVTDDILLLFLLDALPEDLAITIRTKLGNSADLRSAIEIIKSSAVEPVQSNNDRMDVAAVHTTKVSCFKCRQSGHIARFCKNLKTTPHQQLLCQICKKFGHDQMKCWYRNSGNEIADSPAPAKSANVERRQ